LLEAVASGRPDALAQFMRRHEAPLRRYLAVSLTPDDVDDIVQDTFVSAWRNAHGYRGGTSARGWLYTIARHAIAHRVRRKAGEPASLESLEALAERAGWGHTADASAGRRDDDVRDAQDLLARALRRLPADERDVIVLRELDGYSGEETARMLHLTLPAMKSRLHRARLHLAAEVRSLALPEPTSTPQSAPSSLSTWLSAEAP
jgi:RNA polymerase sigma-70 factor, ECF subfamily